VPENLRRSLCIADLLEEVVTRVLLWVGHFSK
jgi:hypothetical protein